jgi:hypothetical protein
VLSQCGHRGEHANGLPVTACQRPRLAQVVQPESVSPQGNQAANQVWPRPRQWRAAAVENSRGVAQSVVPLAGQQAQPSPGTELPDSADRKVPLHRHRQSDVEQLLRVAEPTLFDIEIRQIAVSAGVDLVKMPWCGTMMANTASRPASSPRITAQIPSMISTRTVSA